MKSMHRMLRHGHFRFLPRPGSWPLLLACLVCGCAENPVQPPDPSRLLHDEAFPQGARQAVESAHEVFELDKRTKHYLDITIGSRRNQNSRDTLFINEILQKARKISYVRNANTTASETFQSGTANCLSLSIMTYAMANYLGYDTSFQEVDIPEYWERRNGRNVLARHVNVLLKPGRDPGVLVFGRVIEVDFFAPGSSRQYRSEVIPASRVLAMFYNNKAGDALLAGDHETAYAYLRAALREDPMLGMAISNLGNLYRATGHTDWAEHAYRVAVRVDPDSTVPLEGLAMVLQDTGRHEEAKRLFAEVESRRINNAYYQYIQGEAAYDAGRWQRAIHYFENAIILERQFDPPYFGLAKTYFQLGENGKARDYLERAAGFANSEARKAHYQSKYEALENSM